MPPKKYKGAAKGRADLWDMGMKVQTKAEREQAKAAEAQARRERDEARQKARQLELERQRRVEEQAAQGVRPGPATAPPRDGPHKGYSLRTCPSGPATWTVPL